MKIEIKGSFTRLVKDATLVQDSKTPYTVEFTFDEVWEGFSKTALFEAGSASIAVVLSEDKCAIPADCLKRAGIRLQIAVVGTKGDQRISTGWCVISMILHKPNFNLGGGGSGPVLPDEAYAKIMAVIGDLDAVGFGDKSVAEIMIELRKSISDTATDEEVKNALDDAFGGAYNPPDNPGGGEDSGNTATDKEVGDILDEVFGK